MDVCERFTSLGLTEKSIKMFMAEVHVVKFLWNKELNDLNPSELKAVRNVLNVLAKGRETLHDLEKQ